VGLATFPVIGEGAPAAVHAPGGCRRNHWSNGSEFS
jgi:hypothetical protein